MTTKHTPGPWAAGKNDEVWTVNGRRVQLAQVIHWRQHNATANARLIAAAPDLLAALESCRQEIDGFLMACDQDEIDDSFSGMSSASDAARAAIAKATT